MKIKDPGPLVLVEWLDSCSPVRKWQDPDAMKTYTVAQCRSVGWIISESKERIVLASSVAPDEVGEVTAIPRSCVVKRRRLR